MRVALENSFEVAFIEAFIVYDVLYFAHEEHEDLDNNLVDANVLATGNQLYKGEITSGSDVPIYFRMSSPLFIWNRGLSF